MRSTVAISLLVLALAGCNSKPVPLDLSGVDQRALTGCSRGDALVGEDPVVSARRKENSRACESWKRAELATFIKGIGHQ
jgi:hypothetical protein